MTDIPICDFWHIQILRRNSPLLKLRGGKVKEPENIIYTVAITFFLSVYAFGVRFKIVA